MCVDSLLVHAHQLPVLHEELSVADGGLALTASHAEEHMAVNIGIGEGRKRIVMDYKPLDRKSVV